MMKHILFTATIFILMGLMSPALAQKHKKSDIKFLDEITLDASAQEPQATSSIKLPLDRELLGIRSGLSAPAGLESVGHIQLKYALLLDTEVEEVTNLQMFTAIDAWYGTRYQLGGTTRKGIDCSALVQTLFTTVYNINLPRTAREQFKATRQISRVDLKEGDLVFFNTRGGVSHVGMYLQNNKFIHAASSGGVMISDLYDDYWMRRFIGVGRVEAGITDTALSLQP